MKKLVPFILLAILSFSFTNKQKTKKFKGPENYVFIPSGSTEREGETYSCNAFWMSKHEVTNGEYLFFIKHLIANGKEEDLKKALPDTTKWKTNTGGYLEPYYKYYFNHPSYQNYPVVNVSREGALMYCEYLTQQLKSVYGDVIQNFRLPTEKEWMYAASSGKKENVYSWTGPYLRNGDGDFQANFAHIGEQNITMTSDGPRVVADSLRKENFDFLDTYIIATGDSYWPNEFGLYNMCGNVAEMVNETGFTKGGSWRSGGYDIRIDHKEKFTQGSPKVGFRPVMTFLKVD
ncbi:formylglycine-generating enzyme family protein [Paracrocinitomix mangrovi]|uniref:formylglycine-generating enzyme family protein n=1 Tax=Paracrocinitomix mangrovi TaxID=2862509 RepID=UPI001C8D011D|nr:SUMF1/EgtB/PvdO family nonheme iron enzyme [Paracrocinitomix mangrovi]UKN00648.1 formylglycine-generating enzyme family protein [Paracrocinitomix mangrovi]